MSIAPIVGTALSDNRNGTGQADIMDGLAGDDRLNAASGDDSVYGGQGADILIGGAGNDLLDGDNNAPGSSDSVVGSGDDVIDGGAGNDTAFGGAGNDYISGGTGNDLLLGESGDDLIDGGAGDDTIDGGLGIDEVLVEGVDEISFAVIETDDGARWTVAGTGVDAGVGTDLLNSVEIVTDALGQRTLLVGAGGFATIQAALDAAQNGDTIRVAAGEYGAFTVTAELSDVTILGAFAGTPGAEQSESGASVITDFGSVIQGANITLRGFRFDLGTGTGNSPSALKVTGADATIADNVFYRTASSVVTGGASGTAPFHQAVVVQDAQGATISGNLFDQAFEGTFTGTHLNGWRSAVATLNTGADGDASDILIEGNTFRKGVTAVDLAVASAATEIDDNTVDGYGTFATVAGTSGGLTDLDSLFSGNSYTGPAAALGGNGTFINSRAAANVTFSAVDALAASNTSVINGKPGFEIFGEDGRDDTLTGSDGDDRLSGRGGNDALDGGEGSDTAIYGNGAVTVDLGTGVVSGAFGEDSLTSIENVATGTGNDDITGSSGANVISTGDGNDVIEAAGGNDTVLAGAGTDTVVVDAAVNGIALTTTDAGWQVVTVNDGTDQLIGAASAGVFTANSGTEIVQGNDGKILLVGNGGYASIQAAVDAAALMAGDVTILVAAGDYAAFTIGAGSPDNLTIKAAGPGVVVKGNYSTTTGIQGDADVWFQEHGGGYGASPGILIGRGDVTIEGLAVTDFGTGISFAAAAIDGVLLKNIDISQGLVGMDLGSANVGTGRLLSNLTIEGGSFSHLYEGIIGHRASEGMQSSLTDFTVDGTSFADLTSKGIYLEALNGGTFTGIDMENVGQWGRGNEGFGTNSGGFGAGIDLNLKYGIFSGAILIEDFDFTDVGLSQARGRSEPHFGGAAIAVKARDDAGGYSSSTTTLLGLVTIERGSIDGTSTGIRVGEPKSSYATDANRSQMPGVEIEISEVTITGAVVGAVDNRTVGATMTVTLSDENDSFVVNPASFGLVAVDAGDGLDAVTGGGGSEAIVGGGGDDELTGGGGQDLLTGGAGDDKLDGGTETDLALYLTNLDSADFVFMPEAGLVSAHWQVNAGDEGIDQLRNVEQVGSADPGAPRFLLVGAGGYASIQAAVDAACDGDTILIGSGEWIGDVALMGKSVTLTGQGKDGSGATTIIGQIVVDDLDGGTASRMVDGAVIFTNLAINATGREYGIYYNALAGEAASLTLDGVAISGARENALSYTRPGNASVPDTTTDLLGSVTIADSDFRDNGTSGANGRGHINLFGFTGDLTITGNTFDADAANIRKGVSISGAPRNGAPSQGGNVLISDNTIGGTYLTDFFSFYTFAGFESFAGSGNVANLTAPWGVVNFDKVGSDIDLTGFFASVTNLAAVPVAGVVQGDAGNNAFTGTDARDVLNGNAGDDLLKGGGGDDLLVGGDGDDELHGEAGTDTLTGGLGNDVYVIDGDDVIVELDGQGTDTVKANISIDLSASAAEIENVILLGDGNLSATGTAGANAITGNSGNNILDGGGGNDSMEGGAGDDLFITDGDDSISDSAGNDTVRASVDYTLGDGIEALELSGTARAGTGNELNNSIFGTNGNDTLQGMAGLDTLSGGEGDDSLVGGSGADSLVGGNGNDTYVIDADDTLVELAGGGNDTVKTSASYTLLAEFESLILTGDGDIAGTGNSVGNLIIGNDGNNILDGAGGDDTLHGGLGNDSYIVDSANDVVVEGFDAGYDRVTASVTVTLTADVEELVLSGSANINGTGNDLGNLIIGNDGNNVLSGGAGADTLVGGLGNDVLSGGADIDWASYAGAGAGLVASLATPSGNAGQAAGDTYIQIENLQGGDFADQLTGNGVANVILGGNGADTLYGLGGDDLLEGGDGADVLVGGSGGDTLNGGDGTDMVSYAGNTNGVLVNLLNPTLNGSDAAGDIYISIENIEGSAGGDDLTGDDLDNLILGLGGSDAIYGMGGNDTIVGGAELDILDGGSGTDLLNYEASAAGVTVSLLDGTGSGGDAEGDILSGFEDLRGSGGNDSLTGDNLANRIWAGAGNDTVVGGGGNDTLDGEDGADTLDGGLGADSMSGGFGDDVYVVDNVGDVVNERSNRGTDTVLASVTYSISGQHVENLTLTGSADINGTGSSLDNLILGNTGNNLLNGGSGSDTLDGGDGADTLMGGSGADSMSGGFGDDVYIVDNVGDVVNERSNRGTDTVFTSVTFSISGQHIETLVLTGSAAINGTGSSQDNLLIGNAGNNQLNGGHGNDTLEGGLGADRLNGGSGSDQYVLKSVAESTVAASGRDVITAWATGDQINLSAIDADTAVDGDQAFVFLGLTATPAEVGAGQVAYYQADGRTYVIAGVDADPAPDLMVEIIGLHTLTPGDFVL